MERETKSTTPTGEQMKHSHEFWQRVFDKLIASSKPADLEKLEREFHAGALVRWEVQSKTGAESELAARVSADFGVRLQKKIAASKIEVNKENKNENDRCSIGRSKGNRD
jgi:hypothetical protein